MKDDVISRQEAIDALETIGYDFSDSELSEIELEEVCEAVGDVSQDMINIIKRMPSAQSERKTGQWDVNYLSEIYRYRCSACNAVHRARYDFCPSCGAKMKG